MREAFKEVLKEKLEKSYKEIAEIINRNINGIRKITSTDLKNWKQRPDHKIERNWWNETYIKIKEIIKQS